jgi:hypothetical protein
MNAEKDLVDAGTTLFICVGFYSRKGSGKKEALNPSADSKNLKPRTKNTAQKLDIKSYQTTDGQICLKYVLVLFTEQQVGSPPEYIKRQQQPGRTQFFCI